MHLFASMFFVTDPSDQPPHATTACFWLDAIRTVLSRVSFLEYYNCTNNVFELKAAP